MWRELLVALVLAAACVVIHGVGTYGVLLWMLGEIKRHRLLALGRSMWTMLRLMGALLLLHCLEIAVWGQAYVWLGTFPDRYTAYYFSMMNYTTVVWGDVGAPLHWKLLGGLEAMVGILLFGWSTACLVAFVYQFQNARIKEQLGRLSD